MDLEQFLIWVGKKTICQSIIPIHGVRERAACSVPSVSLFFSAPGLRASHKEDFREKKKKPRISLFPSPSIARLSSAIYIT
jgi:hypothetical protein